MLVVSQRWTDPSFCAVRAGTCTWTSSRWRSCCRPTITCSWRSLERVPTAPGSWNRPARARAWASFSSTGWHRSKSGPGTRRRLSIPRLWRTPTSSQGQKEAAAQELFLGCKGTYSYILMYLLTWYITCITCLTFFFTHSPTNARIWTKPRLFSIGEAPPPIIYPRKI